MQARLVRVILACGLTAVVACSGDDGPPAGDDAAAIDAAAIDAAAIDAGDITCNPLAAPGAQGCGAGQKCTWITVTDTPEPIGMLGCAPAGSRGLNRTCTVGPAGPTTGHDDCAAGLVCAN